jgi:hypothetical protein
VLQQQPSIKKKVTLREILLQQLSPQLEAELDDDSKQARLKLESKVFHNKRPFYEIALALAELNRRRLYRSTHRTFESYCNSFGLGCRYVYRLIAACEVFNNLAQMYSIGHGEQILPTKERQIRPLIGFSPEQQCEIWQEAVTLACGQPTSRIVENIVQHKKSAPGFNRCNTQKKVTSNISC